VGLYPGFVSFDKATLAFYSEFPKSFASAENAIICNKVPIVELYPYISYREDFGVIWTPGIADLNNIECKQKLQ
jgi:hypothetical protein